MRIEQRMPVTVADLRGAARRVHDVGEQHRGEHPIIGHVGLLAGEELGDLLEGRAPRFDEVVQVAARQLNVFRARYVIGDVLALRRRDERVVGVLEDEGRHADCRKDRPHVQFDTRAAASRATVRGLAARRSIRAHVARISSFHGMSGFNTCCKLSGAPHGEHGSADFLGRLSPQCHSATGSLA